MNGMWILLSGIRFGSVYLLLVSLSLGQARSSGPAAQELVPAASHSVQSQRGDTPTVALDAPVITIRGLCDAPRANNAETSNCETIITRAGFEEMLSAIQPNMPTRARREFATRYADALVMAKKAEQLGLDKVASFEEQMKVARIQILSQELTRTIQTEASQISDKEIIDYYHDNSSSFEQAEVDRIYIPTAHGQASPPDKALSDEEKQSQRSEQLMKAAADQLYKRAITGEDFNNLQADAYKMAGIKTSASASMGKIRRISLPPSHAWVMDLKPGEISSIIAGPNGYFIYKVKAKETLSLDQVHKEIKESLRSRTIQNETRVIQESATPILNEIYFHPRHAPQGTTKTTE